MELLICGIGCQDFASFAKSDPYHVFRWRTGEWGTCSKPCGGGLIERKAICVQAKNGTELQVIYDPSFTNERCIFSWKDWC